MVSTDELTELQARLYKFLISAASRKLPSPTNQQISDVCLNGKRAESYVRSLVARGFITIRNPATHLRIFHIIETGQETALSNYSNCGAQRALYAKHPDLMPDPIKPIEWPKNCFAAHNIKTNGGNERFIKPETIVPRGDM